MVDAEFAQALSDLVVTLTANGKKLTGELASLRTAIEEHKPDSAQLVEAINALRDEVVKSRQPQLSDDKFELITTHTYDKQDRVIETRTRKVRIR